jgi:hypothetical protein
LAPLEEQILKAVSVRGVVIRNAKADRFLKAISFQLASASSLADQL